MKNETINTTESGVRFLHVADVHLGVEPDAGKPWSKKRRQDIWDSFAEVVEMAGQKQVDFLWITGDLFHAQPLKRELKEINYLFSKIPDTKIVLLAGNHDYLNPKSYYLTNQWAENVSFFSREEAAYIDFPEKNVTVYGMSYWHREVTARCYDDIKPRDNGRINVLLAHGGDERHIPFSPAAILQNGFDYLAAGHIHKGGQMVAGRAVMAGSLEPTDCNDTGAHGYWLGELQKGGAKVQFVPVRKCEYCHEVFPVTSATTEQEVSEWAKNLTQKRPAYQYFRLRLEGRADPETEFDLKRLEELARVVDVQADLTPDYDYEKLEKEYEGSLLGYYVNQMRKKNDAVSRKALEYGVNALLGHKICR